MKIPAHSYKLSVLGAINSIDGDYISMKKKYKYFDQNDFKEFVKKIEQKNKHRKIALFLDNCSIHYGKEMKKYFKTKEGRRIKLVFNRIYSP